MKQIRNKKIWTNGYAEAKSAVEDLEVLYDFHKEGEATVEELQKSYDLAFEKVDDLEFKNMLSAEEDSLSAVLQITSGAGGPACTGSRP